MMPDIRTLLRKAVNFELVDSYASYQAYYNTVIKTRQRIEALGVEALEGLVAALHDEDYRVRGLAATLLGKLNDARAIPPLRDALDRETEPDTVKAIRNARSKLRDEQHIAELIHELRRGTPEQRAEAVRLLSKTRENALIPHLKEGLDDDAPLVRDQAIRALGYGRARDDRIVEDLIRGLHDDDAGVRLTAVKTLKRNRSGDPRIFMSLLAAVHDDDTIVQRAVLTALRDFKDERCVPVFRQYITHPDHAIREAAMRGLHDLAPPAALHELIQFVYTHVMEDDAPWFWMVASALGDIGNPAAIPALIDFMQHPNTELRPAAVKALITIGSTEAVAPLLKMLKHQEAELRLYAAAILGRLGDRRAEEGLRTLADVDPDPQVQQAAANALVNLDNRATEKADLAALLRKLAALLNAEGLPRLEEVRKTMADIAEHRSEQALPPLSALVENRFPSIRRAAVMALGTMQLPSARETLHAALDDDNVMVRLYARRALEGLEG
jgi:HEAT repeat protein